MSNGLLQENVTDSQIALLNAEYVAKGRSDRPVAGQIAARLGPTALSFTLLTRSTLYFVLRQCHEFCARAPRRMYRRLSTYVYLCYHPACESRPRNSNTGSPSRSL